MVRHPEVGPGLLTVLAVTKVVVLLVLLTVTMLLVEKAGQRFGMSRD
jgi:hypothetical protein